MPIFIAEVEVTNQNGIKFTICSRGVNIKFPDECHKRNSSAQSAIEKLPYVVGERRDKRIENGNSD